MTGVPLNKRIYAKYQLGPASHMTHIENLDSIFRDGFLRSKNRMSTTSYHDLANEDVQTGRATKTIDITGRPLHDYVPLYFGSRTPMVAWNQTRNEEIVFLRFSLDVLEGGAAVISDGNARSGTTKFRVAAKLTDLGLLDPKAINTVKYANDPEVKRRKQAELLILHQLPLKHLLDLICYSETAKARILEITYRYGKDYPVRIRPGTWFFKPRAATGEATE